MPAPTTSVIETFTGADATSPPNASWTRVANHSFDLRIQTNQCESSGGGLALNFWNPATFGPDCEAYVTVNTLPTTDADTIVRLYLRMQTPATTHTGYRLVVTWKSASADQWNIQREDNNTNVNLSGTPTQDVTAGDKIWFSAAGNILTGYLFTGGSWTSIVSYDITSDGTKYTTAGNIALGCTKQVIRLDNFGGGTTVLIPVNTVAPAETGTETEGQTLSCSQGTWSPAGDSYAYQWQRDTAGNLSFSDIGGATASTRVLAQADVGNKLRCVVTATNGAGSASANSNATAGLIGDLFSASPADLGFEFLPGALAGLTSQQNSLLTDPDHSVYVAIGMR
jgi:hypothetical protein